VNFNSLTTAQQAAIAGGSDIYDGLGGSDVVTLPNEGNYNESVGNGITLGWTDTAASTFYTGSQPGDIYTIYGGDGGGLHRNPPTHYGIEDLKLWTLLAQQNWTAAAARMAKTGGDPDRREADANLLLNGLTVSLPVIESGQQVASNDTNYNFSISDSSTQYALDPAGPYLSLTTGLGSPNITSIQLPAIDGTEYLVSYEIGTSWSTPQLAQPYDTLTFPSGAANGIRVTMLDSNGNVAQGSPDFVFYLTFASSGTFSGQVVSSSTPFDPGPTAGNTAITVGHNQTVNETTLVKSLVTPGLPGDTETVISVTGNASLSGSTITYNSPATGTDSFTYTVQDELGNTATGTVNVTIDPGPAITSVTLAVVEKGQMTAIGTVTPGLPGDTLTLKQTGGNGNALQLVNGVEEVIYTAPSVIAASTQDTVSYTITDQYNDVAASGAVAVQLDAGPSITSATPSVVEKGQTTEIATVAPSLKVNGVPSPLWQNPRPHECPTTTKYWLRWVMAV
jgi:hypothetical protein